MKLNKGMLLVLVAGMSFSGMLQAVSGRYYNMRMQNVEAMLNGKKPMDYAAAQKNLDELRIALNKEAKSSDRYKRFANAEKRFFALAPARAAIQTAAATPGKQVVPIAAAPGGQVVRVISAEEEAAALAAADIADEAEQQAIPGFAAPDMGEQEAQGLPAPQPGAAAMPQSTIGASAGRAASAMATAVSGGQSAESQAINEKLNSLEEHLNLTQRAGTPEQVQAHLKDAKQEINEINRSQIPLTNNQNKRLADLQKKYDDYRKEFKEGRSAEGSSAGYGNIKEKLEAERLKAEADAQAKAKADAAQLKAEAEAAAIKQFHQKLAQYENAIAQGLAADNNKEREDRAQEARGLEKDLEDLKGYVPMAEFQNFLIAQKNIKKLYEVIGEANKLEAFIEKNKNINPGESYKVLGVAQDATLAQVTKAYRQLSREYHPDKNPNNKALAQEVFKIINEAYDTMKKNLGV